MSASSGSSENQNQPNESRPSGCSWDPDDLFDALKAERSAYDETIPQQAARLLEEALPGAVHSIVRLANFGQTEKMRFDASKYIIDRNLGAVTKEGDLIVTAKDPLDELLESVTYEVPNN